MAEEQAPRRAGDDYEEYAAALREFTSKGRFAYAAALADLAQQRGDSIRRAATSVPDPKSVKERATAMLESSTWKLIHDLYQIHLGDGHAAEDAPMKILKAVVNWLEHAAGHGGGGGSGGGDAFGSDAADDAMDDAVFRNLQEEESYWPRTLAVLEEQPPNVPAPPGGGMVSQLDPDAAFRENAVVHEHDQEDEARLMSSVWFALRAGDLLRARELCRASKRFWWSASLAGCIAYCHSPGELQGNPEPYRALWRHACRCLAREAHDHCEQAIYGLLGGMWHAARGVCITWEDHLWLYSKALYETHLHANYGTTEDVIVPADPPAEEPPFADFAAAFTHLRASRLYEAHDESRDEFHELQAMLVTNDVRGAVLALGGCKAPPSVLKFAAHAVLFFCHPAAPATECGGGTGSAYRSVLRAYLRHLNETRHYALFALYTSLLPKTKQVRTYSQFLLGLEDRQLRQQCLISGEHAGLPMDDIRSAVVSDVAPPPPPPGELPDADEDALRAVEWLCLDQESALRALLQANALLRTFLERDKLALADRLTGVEATMSTGLVLPAETPALVRARAADPSADAAALEDALAEFNALKAYVRASLHYAHWRELQALRPVALEAPAGEGARYSETLVYERTLRPQYETAEREWRERATAFAEEAERDLLALLQWPVQPGWLVDEYPYTDEERAGQLERLRRKCLPDAVFMLHELYAGTSRSQRALCDVASMVAGDERLLSLFGRERLRALLRALRTTSLGVLDTHADPLGIDPLCR
eukprot:TRINITY_DN18778_c0_g1_i1.p1 TRINITY_DN18778_c0_g1~~TRINITY_DN18778_c0_g1_i1.p1  ORF type:complete len:852 (+),score=190.32 TRINITY_DN18778_c0_g1_i1:260-2557(+)